MCLKAFYRMVEGTGLGGEMDVIGEVDVFVGPWNESTFAMIIQAFSYVGEMAMKEEIIYSTCGRQAIRIADHVYKVFDYGKRRGTAHLKSVKFLGADIVLNAFDGKLVIIKYPFIEGTHTPQYFSQLVQIMERLNELHKEDWVHGDVRWQTWCLESRLDV